MSIESRIAGLMQSCVNLTDMVAQKMAGIDSAVKKAVEGVPAEIRNSMGRTVYLDQANGSDSNDGRAASRAYKSLRKISQETPAGASVEVRIIGNYLIANDEAIAFTGAQVLLRSNDPEINSEIAFSAKIVNENFYSLSAFQAYRNCLFIFFRLKLKLPLRPSPSGTPGSGASIITTHSTNDIPTPLSIRMFDVEFIIPDPLVNPYSLATGRGITMLSTASVIAPDDWVKRGMLLTSMPSASLRTKTRLIYDNDALIPE